MHKLEYNDPLQYKTLKELGHHNHDAINSAAILFLPYVTRSRKRGHFAQEFKIELLVLKGRVALKQ